MPENKLQLSDDKTEALLKDTQNSQNLPLSLSICQTSEPLVKSARDLGVPFDSSVSMKQQVGLRKICQTAHLEFRGISSIRHYLTVGATLKTLPGRLFCTIRLDDYCNSLLDGGIPQNFTDALQKVQNSAARLIFRSSKNNNVTPLLFK